MRSCVTLFYSLSWNSLRHPPSLQRIPYQHGFTITTEACQVPSRWPRRSRTNWAAGVAGAVAPSQPGAPHRSPASPSSTAPTLTRLWSPRESCHSEIWTPSCGPLLPANASRPRGSTSWRMTSRSRASILSSQGASAHLLHVPTPGQLYIGSSAPQGSTPLGMGLGHWGPATASCARARYRPAVSSVPPPRLDNASPETLHAALDLHRPPMLVGVGSSTASSRRRASIPTLTLTLPTLTLTPTPTLS